MENRLELDVSENEPALETKLVLTQEDCKILYEELKNHWLSRNNYDKSKPLLEKIRQIAEME